MYEIGEGTTENVSYIAIRDILSRVIVFQRIILYYCISRYAIIMKIQSQQMKPQDVLLLLKIITVDQDNWNQKPIANALGMSQSEVSESVARSKYAGLLAPKGKKVMKMALLEFLQYGIRYVFPQKPGPIVRGVPTAHSAPPLNANIQSNEHYVWPYGKGTVRGQSIVPLYPSVPEAALKDERLHELLALVDALRVGRTRERVIAIAELKKRIQGGE
jgi:predicted XRE-type DNA-binding protein